MKPSEFAEELLGVDYMTNQDGQVKFYATMPHTGQEVVGGRAMWASYPTIDMGSDPHINFLISETEDDRARHGGKTLETALAKFVASLVADERISHGVLAEMNFNGCLAFWTPSTVCIVEMALPDGESRVRAERVANYFSPALEQAMAGSVERRTFQADWGHKATAEHDLARE